MSPLAQLPQSSHEAISSPSISPSAVYRWRKVSKLDSHVLRVIDVGSANVIEYATSDAPWLVP